MEYNKIENNQVPPAKKDTQEVSTTPDKKIKKQVVTNGVKKRKKGVLERLVVGMLGPDGLPAIGSYLGKEIVLPAIKNIIVDSITSGINMAMFGDGNRSSTPHSRTPVNHQTNYASRYTPSTTQTQYSVPTAPRPAKSQVVDYLMPTRDEAILVLNTLRENAERFGSVSVADYYDAIGVDSSYTDNSYGWDAAGIVGHTTIIGTRGGYIIKFPPVMVL